MGYPSLPTVLEAVRRLTYKDSRELLRTNGLWHVLIFLRHRRLNGMKDHYTLSTSYDLAESCFDLNGIYLPITNTSRNVYYEPAATAGASPKNFFRNKEGPRQTYQNRIQTGLSGRGPRQAKL